MEINNLISHGQYQKIMADTPCGREFRSPTIVERTRWRRGGGWSLEVLLHCWYRVGVPMFIATAPDTRYAFLPLLFRAPLATNHMEIKSRGQMKKDNGLQYIQIRWQIYLWFAGNWCLLIHSVLQTIHWLNFTIYPFLGGHKNF